MEPIINTTDTSKLTGTERLFVPECLPRSENSLLPTNPGLHASLTSTRWNDSLCRLETPQSQSIPMTLPKPQVISIPMGRPSMRTRSYFFPKLFEPVTSNTVTNSDETTLTTQPTEILEDPQRSENGSESENAGDQNGATATGNEGNNEVVEVAGNASNTSNTSDIKNTENNGDLAPWEEGEDELETLPGTTRIRPPRDVIRLEDRLRYLLQPSLQQVFASRSLSCPFRPFAYQFEGVAFLYAREMALLADEMGLGKTMQAILAIRLLLHAGELRSILLVCPKPLVSNWYREFATWAPEIPVQVIEGDQARRHWMWRLENVPVRIANYELVTRDREVFESEDEEEPAAMYAGAFYVDPINRNHRRHKKKRITGFRQPGTDVEMPLKPVSFDLVVLDESQRIRNRSNTTSQVVRDIRRHRSWAMTGTPVENSSDDLLGIFEFLSPGFLTPEMSPRRMGETVRDCVLRRTKDQVLTEMPPKLYRDATLELLPEQKDSYSRATDDGVIQLTDMGDSVTVHHVLELVLRLKQICNFDPLTGASVKAERLEADLEEIAGSGRKALVFSQWVQTLERLGENLERFHPLQYHGRIPTRKRDAVIEEFRNNPDRHVLLMSYGAGGVGLNLQFAQYVFLFDRWWNPALEDQAINRAHRIGAAGQVTVTRFLIAETIEERIDRILQEKRELFETIFSETGSPRKSGLTHQEIFGLFNLKIPQSNGTPSK